MTMNRRIALSGWLVGLVGMLVAGRGTPALAQGAVFTQQEIVVSADLQAPSGVLHLSGIVRAAIHTMPAAEPDPCFLVAVHLDFHQVSVVDSDGVEYHAANNVEFNGEVPAGTSEGFDFERSVKFVAHGQADAPSFMIFVDVSGAIVKEGAGIITSLVIEPDPCF
jgi:hypothetical protein